MFFDRVFPKETSQEEVYEVVKGLFFVRKMVLSSQSQILSIQSQRGTMEQYLHSTYQILLLILQ